MKASELLCAPAKLNLTLEVLQRRPDGLHGVRSVMVPVDLCDELSVETQQSFSFECDAAELVEDNLVLRALAALGLQNAGARIALRKRIPSGAGMGGGSSDAAAILLAAQRGVFGEIGIRDYLTIARSLGSDVPFFLAQTAALVEGTGERVTALGPVPPWHALIVKPPVSVSTAWAYEQLDRSLRESRARSGSASLDLAQALQRGQFVDVVALSENDFHDALTRTLPEIRMACDLLRDAGASHALLTGSGSCVFTLMQNRTQRDAVAAALHLPAAYTSFACSFWNGEGWRSAA